MDTRQYLLYHGRWQLSTIVMIGPMTLLGYFDVSRPVSLVLVQVLGAMIFWYVDRWIFNDTSSSSTSSS